MKNISDDLRKRALNELLDDIGLGMDLNGHSVPEEMLLQGATEHLDFMIGEARKTLASGQNMSVVYSAMANQGLGRIHRHCPRGKLGNRE